MLLKRVSAWVSPLQSTLGTKPLNQAEASQAAHEAPALGLVPEQGPKQNGPKSPQPAQGRAVLSL